MAKNSEINCRLYHYERRPGDEVKISLQGIES